MGYHVSIVKSKNRKQVPLLQTEIYAAIEKAPKLSFDGQVLSYENKPFLQFQDGELWIKNPDEKELATMIAFAKSIGGRVRGDEFETYDSPSRSYIHPDDKEHIAEAKNQIEQIKRDRKQKQLILHICIFGFFLILAFFAHLFDS